MCMRFKRCRRIIPDWMIVNKKKATDQRFTQCLWTHPYLQKACICLSAPIFFLPSLIPLIWFPAADWELGSRLNLNWIARMVLIPWDGCYHGRGFSQNRNKLNPTSPKSLHAFSQNSQVFHLASSRTDTCNFSEVEVTPADPRQITSPKAGWNRACNCSPSVPKKQIG